MSATAARLAEIELVASMFQLGSELIFPKCDQLQLGDEFYLNEAANSETAANFSIRMPEGLELTIHLPSGYPSGNPNYPVKPIITVRVLNKHKHINERNLCTAFSQWLEETANSGEPVLCSAIDWLRDAIDNEVPEITSSATTSQPTSDAISEPVICLWIVSHHIRSPIKRRLILEWAGELRLGGCCMPGRPGLVVVEGRDVDADEFWRRLRGLQWKAIHLRHRELLGTNSYSRKRFEDGFHELFLTHQSRFLWLHGRGVTSDLYQIVFGIPGRLPNSLGNT